MVKIQFNNSFEKKQFNLNQIANFQIHFNSKAICPLFMHLSIP